MFAEFHQLNLDGRHELVDGTPGGVRVPRSLHNWTVGRIFRELDTFLEVNERGTEFCCSPAWNVL
jgi:hypothetical protein